MNATHANEASPAAEDTKALRLTLQQRRELNSLLTGSREIGAQIHARTAQALIEKGLAERDFSLPWGGEYKQGVRLVAITERGAAIAAAEGKQS